MDFALSKRNCVPSMIFKNGRLIFPNGVRDGLDILVENGMITAIRAQAHAMGETIVDLEGNYLAPGFIDIQVNGGGGVLLNDDPSEAGVRRIVEAHRRTGTTGCLPTLITDRTDMIERLAAIAQGSLQIPGVLGFHLEGPAINKVRKGIHLESEIRALSARDLAAMAKIFRCESVTPLDMFPQTAEIEVIVELSPRQSGTR